MASYVGQIGIGNVNGISEIYWKGVRFQESCRFFASFRVLGYFPVLLEDLLLPMQFEEFKSALQRMSGCLSNPSPTDDGSEE